MFRIRPLLLLKRLLVVGLLTAVSTATPIFASVVGTLAGLVGELYGNNWGQDSTPSAFVMLGGGLTDTIYKDKSLIILNKYSYHRTETLWHAWQETPLPIITSGVESPWIIATFEHLNHYHEQKPTIISENASMNTCENARFTSKLIAHEVATGTLPPTQHIYLVSDWYHMARARRQFAQAGIATTPLIAPMPEPLAWDNPKSNLNHSRRAFYETLALARDIFRPQKDCRNADDISIDTLKTPKNSPKTF